MPIYLKIRDIGASKHKSEDFALTTIYIPSIDKKSHEVYASINCKLHLVDRLKANMLVDNDMLCIEEFTINLAISSALIRSCVVKININVRQHSEFLRHRALASTPTIISPHLEALVAFQHIELPNSCDFLCYPFPQQHLILYSHLFNHSSTKVLVRNNADYAVKIPLYHRLGCVIKLPYKSCFATSANLDVTSIPPTLPAFFHDQNCISIPLAENLET